MRKKLLKAFVILLILAVIFIPTTASALENKSLGRYWGEDKTHIYFVYESNEFTAAEIYQMEIGMSRWGYMNTMEEADILGVHKKYLHLDARTSTTYDGIVTKNIFEWNGSDAVAICIADVESGELGTIGLQKIRLNPAFTFSTTVSANAYHLQTIMAHEFGHALGVAHCHEEGESCRSSTCSSNIMNPTINKGEARYVPQPYDYSSYFVIYQY